MTKNRESRSARRMRIRKSVWNKTYGVCAHCGKKVKTAEWTIDHYIPKKYAGRDDLRNLMPLCQRCNVKKDDSIICPASFYKYVIQELIRECDDYKEEWRKENPDTVLKLQRKGILIPEEEETWSNELHKDRTRALRRKKGFSKATRKRMMGMQVQRLYQTNHDGKNFKRLYSVKELRDKEKIRYSFKEYFDGTYYEENKNTAV